MRRSADTSGDRAPVPGRPRASHGKGRVPCPALLFGALLAMAAPTAHAQSVCEGLYPFGLLPPEGGFQSGCASPYVLRQGPGARPTSGYLALDYPACSEGPCAGLTGALLFVCATANGYSCCVGTGQAFLYGGGVWVGPLRDGLTQRFALDTDQRAGICHAEYSGNGARLGTVPLIRYLAADSVRVEVTGFIRMFLSGPPAGNGTAPVEFVGGPTPVRGVSWGGMKVTYR